MKVKLVLESGLMREKEQVLLPTAPFGGLSMAVFEIFLSELGRQTLYPEEFMA